MPTQTERGRAFRALHQRPGAFLIPNPWDIGTARLLEHLGFEALATTSAGCAFAAGLPDGGMGRDRVLEHVVQITAATKLPVSADLENGFGDSPDTVAETIRMGAGAGLVGGSIEDYSGRPEEPLYPLELAAERIRAAAEAARSLPFPFTLTARAENYLRGRRDLADTIRRLQAFQDAGADVLYAPGLVAAHDIAAVVASVDRPLNVLGGLPGGLGLSELAALGVKRVSVGGLFARVAFGAFLRAASELRDSGTFSFATAAASSRDLNSLFRASP